MNVTGVTFIEIIEQDSAKLITVIEILSPSNKWPGEVREQYQRKQRELYNANVNPVEVDLIRAGPSVFMLPIAPIIVCLACRLWEVQTVNGPKEF